jgi:hypothetical protein
MIAFVKRVMRQWRIGTYQMFLSYQAARMLLSICKSRFLIFIGEYARQISITWVVHEANFRIVSTSFGKSQRRLSSTKYLRQPWATILHRVEEYAAGLRPDTHNFVVLSASTVRLALRMPSIRQNTFSYSRSRTWKGLRKSYNTDFLCWSATWLSTCTFPWEQGLSTREYPDVLILERGDSPVRSTRHCYILDSLLLLLFWLYCPCLFFWFCIVCFWLFNMSSVVQPAAFCTYHLSSAFIVLHPHWVGN